MRSIAHVLPTASTLLLASPTPGGDGEGRRHRQWPTGSIDAVQDAIIRELRSLDGLRATYEHLIALGRDAPDLPEELRIPEAQVGGCQAQVWIHASLEDGRVRFQVESDAMIVKGLAVLLARVLSGRTPREVATARLRFLEETELARLLSPTRANGLHAMVARMRAFAQGALDGGASA